MRESREISQIYDYDGVTTLISWWESPAFPSTRKISRLIGAVAILDSSVMPHPSTARNDRGAGRVVSLEHRNRNGDGIPPSSFRAVVRAGMKIAVKIVCEKESRNLSGKWL